MAHKLLTIFAAGIMSAASISGQTKLDLSLDRLSKTGGVETARSMNGARKVTSVQLDRVSVIGTLEQGAVLPADKLDDLGIAIDGQWGSLVSLEVPVSTLNELDGLSEFRSFSQSRKFRLCNRTSHDAESVDVVQNATLAKNNGLQKTYTGKGVLVGVHDSYIDFNHNNFRDPSTHKTRIKRAIIYRNFYRDDNLNLRGPDGQRISSIVPYKETYDTEAGIDTLTTDTWNGGYGGSHGTHTSGTAAGSYNGDYLNYYGNVNYTGQRGTAYEADLVLSGAKELEDAAMYASLTDMDELATKLNEPLVVNLSLGSNGGWMDGKDESNTFFNEFTENGTKKGRIVCISAGNEGDGKFSIYKELNSTNNYTLQTFVPADDDGYRDIYMMAYSDDESEFTVQIDLYDKSTNQKRYTFYTNDKLISQGYLSVNHYSAHNNRFAALISYMSMGTTFDSYKVAFVIKAKDTTKPCRVRLFMLNGLDLSPYELTDEGVAGFTAGDNTSSINPLAVTDAVLSVGAWTASNTYTSYTNKSYDKSSEFPLDDVAYWSSFIAETDNGGSKPDFVAPGYSVKSGLSCYNSDEWNPTAGKVGTLLCGKASEEWSSVSNHVSLLGSYNGTSMACPNAAGVVALMLEANPDLTVNEIREIIKETADTDSYVAAKKAQMGCGKLNALAALKKIEEQTTDIVEVQGSGSEVHGLMYNLNGQRVGGNAHGLFIVDGQKVIR